MAVYNPILQPATLFHTRTAQMPPRARVLFVHGAWHGAWCWERWQPLFAARGFDTYAVDLYGHGSRAADGWTWRAGIDDYVRCVRRAVDEIGPCVLVGHSMGGFTVMKYLEQYGAEVPAAVLLAPVPHTGFPLGNILKIGKYQPSALIALLLSMPLQIRSEALVRDAFFSPDIDDATVKASMARLCRESARAGMHLTFKRGAPAKISTKTLVVHAETDFLIPGDGMRALAKALPNGEYLELKAAAHDMMLDTRWEANGAAICDWLDAVGAHTEKLDLSPPPNWKHASVKRLVPRPTEKREPALPPTPGVHRELIHRPGYDA